MNDSKVLRGQRDRSTIDVNDPVDVEYLHHQFPWFTRREIKEVIEKHGPDRAAVEHMLERSGAGSQEDDE